MPFLDEDLATLPAPSPAPRQGRRLSDKLLAAFHQACDLADFEMAAQLLQLVEALFARLPLDGHAERRRNVESLVAAHERLWNLRHPSGGR